MTPKNVGTSRRDRRERDLYYEFGKRRNQKDKIPTECKKKENSDNLDVTYHDCKYILEKKHIYLILKILTPKLYVIIQGKQHLYDIYLVLGATHHDIMRNRQYLRHNCASFFNTRDLKTPFAR